MPELKINIKDNHQVVEICISSQFREPFVRTFGVDAALGVHLTQLLATDDVLIAEDTNPMQMPQRLAEIIQVTARESDWLRAALLLAIAKFLDANNKGKDINRAAFCFDLYSSGLDRMTEIDDNILADELAYSMIQAYKGSGQLRVAGRRLNFQHLCKQLAIYNHPYNEEVAYLAASVLSTEDLNWKLAKEVAVTNWQRVKEMGTFLPLAGELLFESARAQANLGETASATDSALEACCIFFANNMTMHFQFAEVLYRALSFLQKQQPLRIEK